MMRLGCFLAAIAVVAGQNPPRPAGVVDANIASVANLPAQKIAPNDLVGISVYDAPELTRTVRVDSDGTITLPMIKNPIDARGLMPRELEGAIAKALKDGEILVEPLVKVTVVEYYSRPISVVGAVRRPVTFQAVGTVTLLEALARAEGLTEYAGREIVLTNADGTRRIAVKDLIERAAPEANVRLTGGEEIRIPEAGKVFVVGNVKKPGAFPVRDSAEFSVMKAIALAEGLAPFAAKTAYIYRKDAAGVQQEHPIEMQRLLRRQVPDQALEPNDVLYIPDNNGKRLGMAALEKVLLFGSTAGATALVWRP